jgi:hypothetical protein
MDGRVKPGNDDLSRPGINEPTGNAKRNKKESTISCQAGGELVLFFRNDRQARFAVLSRDRRFGGQRREPTREWRRKPLKWLETDSEMAIAGPWSLGRGIDQANSVSLRGLKKRPVDAGDSESVLAGDVLEPVIAPRLAGVARLHCGAQQDRAAPGHCRA